MPHHQTPNTAIPTKTHPESPKTHQAVTSQESVRFWHWWMAGERLFFAKDRPWRRADLIVSGDAPAGVEQGEIAWAPGPLLAG